MLVTGGFVAAAPNTRAAEGTNNVPDKRQYNLFNPTPDQFMRELSADRPDKTDCPFTVDAGHFQLEMDYANYTWDSPSVQPAIKTEGYQLSPMNLKVGVLNNVDLQLVLDPYRRVRIKDETSGAVQYQAGFGDLTPRAKVNLVGNDGGFIALALIPFVKIPTAQDNLGNGAYEGGLGIPYAFDVPNWDIGLQTTFSATHDDVGSGYHAEFANSISIGHALIGKLSYSVEFFSSVSTERGAGWVGTVDTWLTYQLRKNLRLDVGAYIGVTKAADDLHLWLGMTWRH
jgi:hypothetical protein